MDDKTLLARLREEVGVPAGEDDRLAAKLATARGYVSHAVGTATVWESGGPTQLTDGDAIHLTESYSVYGYMAIGATDPAAMLPIKFEEA